MASVDKRTYLSDRTYKGIIIVNNSNFRTLSWIMSKNDI